MDQQSKLFHTAKVHITGGREGGTLAVDLNRGQFEGFGGSGLILPLVLTGDP